MTECTVWPGPESNPPPCWYSGIYFICPGYFPCPTGATCNQWHRAYEEWLSDWQEEWPPN